MSLPAELQKLQGKYLALLRLRRSREALQARGILQLHGELAVARRTALRHLAQDFPGSLRELEHLDVRALQARLRDLRDELRQARAYPRRRRPRRPWVRAVLAFHANLREGLAIRRWLAAHRQHGWDETALVRHFISWYQHYEMRQASLRMVDAAWLRRYQRLPHGRLTELVWQDLAARFGRRPATVQRWILGV